MNIYIHTYIHSHYIHKHILNIFVQTPAPSLWFYSKSDPVARWEDCEIVMNKMRSKGTIVEQCVWDNTPHIQHARLDPDRYFNTLETFLKTHNAYHHGDDVHK
jgi:hypothetical protein